MTAAVSAPMGSRRYSIPTAIGVALLIAVAALQLGGAVHFARTGFEAIRYPYSLESGEGVVVNQTLLLVSGNAYQPLTAGPPYVIDIYPPVFHLLTGALTPIAGDELAAGRAVSVLSALLSALLLAILVWRIARVEIGPLARGAAAAFTGLSFLGVSCVASWGSLMRVDMLTQALGLLGLLTFVMLAGHGRWVYVSALPFLLALGTKQNAIAAPAACLIVALFVDPRLCFKLGALVFGTLLGVFALLNWKLGGQLYFQLVTANNNAYDWHRAAAFLVPELKDRYLVELVVALLAVRPLLASLWTRGARAQPIDWARPVVGVYLITTFLVSLSIGKAGAEVNYLIELMGAVSACVGIALAEGLAGAVTASPRSFSSDLSAVVLPLLLLLPAVGLLPRPAVAWVEIPSPSERQEMEQLIEMVRRADGPVLAEDLTVLLRAGKAVEFHPGDMANLAYQHEWDQSGFIASLDARRYGLVVLLFDVDGPPTWERFTPQMITAIQRNYAPRGKLAGSWIYEPKPQR